MKKDLQSTDSVEDELHKLYPDAVDVRKCVYDLPVQHCFVPLYEEFPYKVTLKNGEEKFFTQFLEEIEYAEYQREFIADLAVLFPRFGKKLTEERAEEMLEKAKTVLFQSETEDEANDRLYYLSYRSDGIGAKAYFLLAVRDSFLSLTSEDYEDEAENLLSRAKQTLNQLPDFDKYNDLLVKIDVLEGMLQANNYTKTELEKLI